MASTAGFDPAEAVFRDDMVVWTARKAIGPH
jgi:hypothetical protein